MPSLGAGVHGSDDIYNRMERMAEDQDEILFKIRETQVSVNKILNLMKERKPAGESAGGPLQAIDELESNSSPDVQPIRKTFASRGAVQFDQNMSTGIEPQEAAPCDGTVRRMSILSQMETESIKEQQQQRRGWSQHFLCTTLPPNWPVSVQLRKGMRGASRHCDDVVMNAHDSPDRMSSVFWAIHMEEEAPPCLGPWNPHAKGMVTFDLLGLVVLMYDLWSTPVQLAWDVPIKGPLYLYSCISVIYWSFAIPIAFRTGYYHHGELKMDTKDIIKNYISKLFLFDVMLVVVDWISVATSNTGGAIAAVKAYRVLRLFKVIRVLKIMNIFDKLVAHRLGNDSKALILLKVASFTFFFTHMMCCAWFAIGNMKVGEVTINWLERFAQDTTAYVYLTAYHWVLAQIVLGSTDVNPTNSHERVFCILLNVFGLLYSSAIVSIVSAQAMEYVTVRRERVEDMSRLSTFLDQHKVELRLANRVRRQATDRLKTNEVMLSEVHVRALSVLSQDLQSEILNVVRLPHVVTHPLFQYWARIDVGATRRLCQDAVHFLTLMAQDCAFMPGSLAKAAFYITSLSCGGGFTVPSMVSSRGVMSYTQSCDAAFVDEEETSIVKAGTWVAEAALWTEWIHVGKLTATCACQLLTVDAFKLQHTLCSFGRVADFTRTYAREFCLRVRVASPPFSCWPNDLRVPGADPDSLLSERASRSLLTREWNAGRLKVSQQVYEELLEEVRSEKSAVVSVPGQGLQRVVFVSTLQLQRADGCILVRIGKWSEAKGVMPASAVLPGIKRDRGELPQKAMKRLLQTDLLGFEEGIEMTHSNEEAEYKESDKYEMMTKYMRTVNFAFLKEDFVLPPLQVAQPLKEPPSDLRWDLNSLPNYCNTEVYVIHASDDKADLYAWLPAEEIELVRGIEEDALKAWILSLDPSTCRRDHAEQWWQVMTRKRNHEEQWMQVISQDVKRVTLT